MKVAIPEGLEYLIQHVRVVKEVFEDNRSNYDFIVERIIGEGTAYFSTGRWKSRRADAMELEDDLSNWFLGMLDSKLQDRAANYLVFLIRNPLQPAYNNALGVVLDYDSLQPYTPKDEMLWLINNRQYCSSLDT